MFLGFKDIAGVAARMAWQSCMQGKSLIHHNAAAFHRDKEQHAMVV